jgi:tripartite-type tricarboxylate transporter receptor subunit TctC
MRLAETLGEPLTHPPPEDIEPATGGRDLLGGQVQVYFGGTTGLIEYIRSGIRALAVTTTTRAETLPELPTVAESVPGYEASGWQGIGAPRNTPGEIIEKLNQQINSGLVDPKIKAQLADLGEAPLVLSPDAFGKLIAGEGAKWGKVIRAANIKPE